MTATAAKSARPLTAAIAWASADGIMVEFPTKDGPPYVVRYPKTLDGLQTALNLLLENPAPRTYQPTAEHPVIQRKETVKATPEQRAAAADVVRRLFK